jgi:hypothetical protein
MRRWLLACLAAEAIGMTAAALAARLGQDLVDAGGARWPALLLVVVGGLVEGTALGVLQGTVLASRWPRVRRGAFVALTVVVAGVGWAGASAPGVLADPDAGGTDPALGLVLLGAAGIGLVMGPVLGCAQLLALRGAVRHPWRWVVANAAAWPVAMVVIFAGATTAGAEWSVAQVAAYGTLTGALAGAGLGLVSGAWLDSLDGQPVANRVVLALLERRRFGLKRSLVGLAVRGRRSGQVRRFPVQYAAEGDDLLVVPGHADRKTWWRNLDHDGTRVEVLRDGRWLSTEAELLLPGDPTYVHAAAAYRKRWRQFEPEAGEPVVVLRGVATGIPAASGRFESVG